MLRTLFVRASVNCESVVKIPSGARESLICLTVGQADIFCSKQKTLGVAKRCSLLQASIFNARGADEDGVAAILESTWCYWLHHPATLIAWITAVSKMFWQVMRLSGWNEPLMDWRERAERENETLLMAFIFMLFIYLFMALLSSLARGFFSQIILRFEWKSMKSLYIRSPCIWRKAESRQQRSHYAAKSPVWCT